MAEKKHGGARPGAGRPKGSQSKMTREVKQMILDALDEAGGVKYLVKQAKQNPKAFLTLIGKVLPLQVTGEGGGPVDMSFTVQLVKAGDAG